MSIEPRNPPLHEAEQTAEVCPSPPAYHWYHKVSAVLFIILCLEIGTFLLIFPWLDYWETNLFSTLLPGWYQVWVNSYVRGAVSGLGAVNLYIGFIEIFRLRRFARH